jgi:hypothetical protein
MPIDLEPTPPDDRALGVAEQRSGWRARDTEDTKTLARLR